MTVTTHGPLPGGPHDVVVVGAGVVGTAIARHLAHHRLTTAVVDAGDDVGTGTSKANTAILHTGFDAVPGSLEATLVREGQRLLAAYAAESGIPLEPVGALLVAWDEEQLAALPGLAAKARRNGCHDTRLLGAAATYAREPHLGPGALGSLHVPGESVICPWTTTLAYATQAVRAGVGLHLNCRVHAVTTRAGHHEIATGRGTLTARYLVNAAGLHADDVDRLLGHHDFTVTPRRGQLIVHDRLARPLVRHILLPVPTALGKGVLVAPTVHGNVLLGPTAEDLDDRQATHSTAAGLTVLREQGRRILPALDHEEVTAVYAGLRAATEHDDYRIRAHPAQRYVAVGSIRSTGLTASMAIAAHVAGLLADCGLDLGPARPPEPVRMPPIGEEATRPYLSAGLVARDPAYGTVVCHCERVTEGEIRDAVRSTVPPASLDGLRRRTRARAGRCQGFFCGAAVRARFEAHRAAAAAAPPQLTPGTRPGSGGGTGRRERHVDVLVVGAGPAGLAAAARLAALGAGRVEILEREQQPGGIPRHSLHRGFGPRHRPVEGPVYVRPLVAAAVAAGAVLRTRVAATGWAGPRTLDVSGPDGPERITARAVVLATGARERSRGARLIPGTRPEGVLTTGELQQDVHLYGRRPGRRAVVVGAESVALAAVRTLRAAGTEVVALVTDRSRAPLRSPRGRVPVVTGATVTELTGRGRLTGVRLRCADGVHRLIDCDTVVLTGDWTPEHELARLGGLVLDPATRGPAVDTGLRTTVPGVFAAGNLLHGTEPAAVAAEEGRHAARAVLRHLHSGGAATGHGAPAVAAVPVEVAAPLLRITPNLLSAAPAPPPGGRFLLRAGERVARPVLVAAQAGRVIGRAALPATAVPDRSFPLHAPFLAAADPSAGPVRLTLLPGDRA